MEIGFTPMSGKESAENREMFTRLSELAKEMKEIAKDMTNTCVDTVIISGNSIHVYPYATIGTFIEEPK